MDNGIKAGHWMGEANFQDRPFTPKVLVFKLIQSELISKMVFTSYFPLWIGLRIAFPCFIPMHIGFTAGTIREQLGTDMLAQYGNFGTK